MDNALSSTCDLHVFIFPAVLLVYYVIAWLIVGRDPKLGAFAPQYEPPAGVTPGVARYILTGGSDGTTLAAVLAGLAAKNIIEVEPMSIAYRVSIVRQDLSVMPEEAALLKTLLQVDLPAQEYASSGSDFVGEPDLKRQFQRRPADIEPQTPITQADLQFADQAQIKSLIDAVQNTFHANLNGIYFRSNFRYAGIGVLATFIWGLITAFSVHSQQSIFLTFWLLGFTSIAGLVIGGVWSSRPTHPTTRQRVTLVIVPVFFFIVPGTLIYAFAMPTAHTFVIALLASVLLNSIFFVIMRAPTAHGLEVRRQLAGFREFLLRVEQDSLDRANSPEQKADIINRFLPYAIALGVREAWGDKMAAAFSDAIVER